MNQFLLYIENDMVKARLVEPWEKLTNFIQWENLEFNVTDSPLRMVTWPNLLPDIEPEIARSFLDLIASRFPFSRDRDKLAALCPELLFKQKSNEWVFFGGSFNPWHKGHQACLDLLPKEKLCFIMPDRNPFKEQSDAREPVATTLELIRKIKFGAHHYFVSTFLIHREKNPTVTWIEKLKKDFPQQELSLLMGFDSLRNLHTWVRAEELVKMLHAVYVVSRLEDEEERKAVELPLKQMAPGLKIEFLGGHDYEAISSTAIRNSNSKK